MLQVSNRLSSVAADGGSAMTAGAVAPLGSGPSTGLVIRRLTSATAQALTAGADLPGGAPRPSDNLQTAPSIIVNTLTSEDLLFCVRVLLTLAVLGMFSSHAFAHGGGTDASGCHTNHSTGDYHCHTPAVDAVTTTTGTVTTITGTVTEVVDGDTFDIGETRIRLAGFDAPEINQSCLDVTGGETQCGRSATEYLEGVVGDQTVTCTVLETDRYGRSVCTCEVDGADIGTAMVSQGHAVDDDRYDPDYSEAEMEARDYRRGIHAGTFVTPRSYRSGDRVQPLDNPLPVFTPSDDGITERDGYISGDADSRLTPGFSMSASISYHETVTYETDHGAFDYESPYFWSTVRVDTDGSLSAYSLGDEPLEPLAGAGTATWEGKIIGFLLDGTLTSGDASISVDLADLTGDAHFTDIIHFGNLRYAFEVNGNTFSSEDGEMAGSFFGDEHQGVGGVVVRSDIVGAFGAEQPGGGVTAIADPAP